MQAAPPPPASRDKDVYSEYRIPWLCTSLARKHVPKHRAAPRERALAVLEKSPSWEYSALGSAGGQQRLDARAADVPNGLDGGATAPMGPATSAPEPGAPSGRAGGEKGLGIERELRVEGLSAYWDTGVRACVSV